MVKIEFIVTTNESEAIVWQKMSDIAAPPIGFGQGNRKENF